VISTEFCQVREVRANVEEKVDNVVRKREGERAASDKKASFGKFTSGGAKLDCFWLE